MRRAFLAPTEAGSDAAAAGAGASAGAAADAGAGAGAGVVCYPLASSTLPGPLELLSGCRFIV